MLEKNIPKLYLIKFFTMFLVLMPVIVPFFLSAGIDMKEVYLLQSIFAVTVFICEVPSGYISDLLGRKNTMVAAHVLKAIGFSLFPFAENFTVLAIAEVILGIAVSLSSGTDTALIYDTLEASGSKKAHIKILGKSLYYITLGEACASLVGSVLLLLAFTVKDLAIISAIISWVPLFICFGLVEPERQKMSPKTHKENAKYIWSGMFKQSRLLNLILLNSVFSFLGTLLAVWMFQKYWQEINIPIVYFGFLWAGTNLAASLASKNAHKVEKKIGSVATLVIVGVLPVIGFFGISLTDHILGFSFCLLFQVCRGIGQVVYKDALNKRVTTDFRATANSIMQMGVRILFVPLGPLFGYLIDNQGVYIANRTLGIAYATIFVLVLIPLLRERKNFMKIN